MKQSSGHIYGLIFSLSLFAMAPVARATEDTDCDAGPVVSANHTIEFKGVVYDAAHERSTWYYTVVSGRKPAISHVTFALLCADIKILDAGIWSGDPANEPTHLSKAGKPEPASFSASPKGDPTTGFVGLKFDLGFNDNASRNYYFTVDGQYAQGPMNVAFKAGRGFTSGFVCGPASDCSQGETPRSSLGDYVWLDANGNGMQDDGESGVAGVTVELLDAIDEVIATTTTDAAGFYLFDDLVNGDYRVKFVLPAGYLFTTNDAGSGDDLDSDADPVTGRTALVSLESGEHRRDVDAGLVLSSASIRLTKTGTFIPGTLDPWDACDVFAIVKHFNAFIFGDLNVLNSGDTEGRLAVAGTANFAAGYSVGYAVFGNPMPEFFGGKVDGFVVGEDLFDGAWGVNGNIVYAGERTGPARYMINGNLVRKVSAITFDANSNVPADGSGLSFAEIRDRMLDRSAALAALADRGVVTKEREPWSYGSLVLIGDDPELNVFHVTAAAWSSTSTAIRVSAPASATVVINVHGANVGILNGAMQLEGLTRNQVLINYVDAEFVSTSGFSHEGAVLAMHASFNFNGGAINGRAVIGGDVTTTSGFEFHNFEFEGEVCLGDQLAPPVPPSIVYAFTVENTGDADLVNVTIHDPLVTVAGGPVDLPAGATDSTTFTATLMLDADLFAAGGFTNIADAIGYTTDGRAVADTDDDVQIFPEIESPLNPDGETGPPVVTENEQGKADFVVQSVSFVPTPTVALTTFRTQVRVVNAGDRSGSLESVAIWPALTGWDNNPSSTPAQEIIDTAPLAPGESRVYESSEFTSPGANETFHVIARVNRGEATGEYSYGNNFGGATYSLQPVEVAVNILPDGTIQLTWNSAEGFYYFVDRTSGLNQPFEDIATNLAATPPVNEFIDADPPADPAFYRVWGYRP